MKRVAPILFLLLVATALIAVQRTEAQKRGSGREVALPAANGCAAADVANLVENPSFEGAYSAYVPPDGHPDCELGVCQTAQMAPGWTPWWRSHDPADPEYIIRMPEYKPASAVFSDPVRVRTGDAAQQFFTFFSTHEAGFYQQVTVTPGYEYCFSIWGHSWSAQDDDDAYSGPEDGELMQKVGVDPTGGTDWQSPEIIWTVPITQYDVYGQFAVTATAEAATMTVFVYSQPSYAVKHNDVYWDDGLLIAPAWMSVPAINQSFLAAVSAPVTFTQSLQISLTGQPNMSWSAAFSPTGTFTPTLSAGSGVAGEPLTVTVDSSGYVTGTYTATLVISSTPEADGSPAVIPLTLIVAPEIYDVALPAILRP